MLLEPIKRCSPWTRFLLSLFLLQFATAKQLKSLANHSYKIGENITMYASKVGPYDNLRYHHLPFIFLTLVLGFSETYRYYSFAFCTAPGGPGKVLGSLGEFLEGDRLVRTAYNLPFATDLEYRVACKKKLTPIEVQEFRDAVESDYYYQVTISHFYLNFIY